jgi:hypothetical protein
MQVVNIMKLTPILIVAILLIIPMVSAEEWLKEGDRWVQHNKTTGESTVMWNQSNATDWSIPDGVLGGINPVKPEYPQEYYTLGDHIKNTLMSSMGNPYSEKNIDVIRNMNLYRQTLALERQNELMAEQNTLLKNMSMCRWR